MADDMDDVDALLEEPYKNKVSGLYIARVQYQPACIIKSDKHGYNMIYHRKKGTSN